MTRRGKTAALDFGPKNSLSAFPIVFHHLVSSSSLFLSNTLLSKISIFRGFFVFKETIDLLFCFSDRSSSVLSFLSFPFLF